MSMRLCEKCKSAENPLGRLRFRKHLDGKIYCENCLPVNVEILSPVAPASDDSPLPGTSAGSMVVIPCPSCRGMSHKPYGQECKPCAGYGSVRIPVNFLNVYKPGRSTGPEPLTEG